MIGSSVTPGFTPGKSALRSWNSNAVTNTTAATATTSASSHVARNGTITFANARNGRSLSTAEDDRIGNINRDRNKDRNNDTGIGRVRGRESEKVPIHVDVDTGFLDCLIEEIGRRIDVIGYLRCVSSPLLPSLSLLLFCKSKNKFLCYRLFHTQQILYYVALYLTYNARLDMLMSRFPIYR